MAYDKMLSLPPSLLREIIFDYTRDRKTNVVLAERAGVCYNTLARRLKGMGFQKGMQDEQTEAVYGNLLVSPEARLNGSVPDPPPPRPAAEDVFTDFDENPTAEPASASPSPQSAAPPPIPGTAEAIREQVNRDALAVLGAMLPGLRRRLKDFNQDPSVGMKALDTVLDIYKETKPPKSAKAEKGNPTPDNLQALLRSLDAEEAGPAANG